MVGFFYLNNSNTIVETDYINLPSNWIININYIKADDSMKAKIYFEKVMRIKQLAYKNEYYAGHIYNLENNFSLKIILMLNSEII
ncbi:hypothetical protein [uncultured archaeal virus]|uniref:Uncharacterized protein n=1 Tax=uncultured archaeal virus TaxID=1960247 RepID=A0A8B0LSE5_9VIRU|nr:hypothetical protein [uncultured archaeal virus]